MLPFKTTTEQKKHLLWLYQEVLLLSYVVTCNNLTVFQRCHCYLNSTGVSDIWKGVSGHSILRNGAQLIRSTHGPRWCPAWSSLSVLILLTMNVWVPVFSDPFSPLPLLLFIFSVISLTPHSPFWRDFLRFLAPSWKTDQNGQLYQIHWDWFSINNRCL